MAAESSSSDIEQPRHGATAAPVRLAPHASGSPQDAPLRFTDARGIDLALLRIDHVQVTAAEMLVTGWSAGPCTPQLLCNRQAIRAECERGPRPDVAKAFNIDEPAEGFGFRFRTQKLGGKWSLRARVGTPGRERTFDFDLRPDALSQAPASASRLALGCLEAAAASPAGDVAVVVGWVMHHPSVQVHIEAADGTRHDLAHAYRFFRSDVREAHGGSAGADAAAGFIALVRGVRPDDGALQLVADYEGSRSSLGELACDALPLDPALAARWLFSIASPASSLAGRIDAIDRPVLEPLMDAWRTALATLPVQVRTLGAPPRAPRVSIVVPLYGRSDFIEHQALEFSRDAWLREHAELIYVLDDPGLADDFASQAGMCFRLHGVPFHWVWGSANRGFSGANNLGLAQARAPAVLFLNSDVFPQAPGWLEKMLVALEADAGIGAVGARLTRIDGAIQHAGIEFVHRPELGFWVNHHPAMGLSPQLDPHTAATSVPAVTGACLLARREHMDAVGGWDEGFLIGDFEDSDLCLRLRARGLRIIYLPTVQLTHLERQSMSLTGTGDFRGRVVAFNALRHQRRWGAALQAGARA